MSSYLILLSGELRALSIVVRYSEYLQIASRFEEFSDCLNAVVADYLLGKSLELSEMADTMP